VDQSLDICIILTASTNLQHPFGQSLPHIARSLQFLPHTRQTRVHIKVYYSILSPHILSLELVVDTVKRRASFDWEMFGGNTLML
jgi:hypothetical protein